MAIKYGKGLYKQTPIVDFYLGTWSKPTIPKSSTDLYITLTAKYNRRPDILSYELYGTTKYWWVFMLRNPDLIFDPIGDFVPGITISYPSAQTLGGN